MFSEKLEYFCNRRQIDKFHEWLFDSCEKFDSFDRNYFSHQFKVTYSGKILKSPPRQILIIWRRFLDEDIFNSCIILELFICFLNHLRICDETVPKAFLAEENELIEATRDKISKFSFTELKDQNQFSLLLRLSLAFGNIVLLKIFYGDKITIDDKITPKSRKWFDLGPTHDYFDGDDWKLIADRCLSTGDELGLIFFQLLIQKLSSLTKSLSTEEDIEIREIYAKNIKKVVDRILIKIDRNPDLINSLDLWRFLTFVPDGHFDQLTQLIVDGVVSCSEDEIPLKLSSGIDKGCERLGFVPSILKSIISKFTSDLDQDLPLSKLYVFMESHQLQELLDSRFNKRFGKLLANTLTKDERISTSSPAFRTLKIFKYLPLEHLQDETQLECVIFLIAMAFSLGLDSDESKFSIDLILPILKADQSSCIFKAFDANHLITTLITFVHQQKHVPEYLFNFISTIIERLSKDHPNPEILQIIESVTDNVLNFKNHVTSQCLTTLLLRIIISIDECDSETATHLVNRLLEDFSSPNGISQHDRAETLFIIMEFFSKSKKPTEKKQKLVKKFTKIYSKLINETCQSISNSKNMNDSNFKSNIKFFLFLCKSSQSSDLLTADQSSLIWNSLFPNYPQIDHDHHTFSDEEAAEVFTAIPLISKFIFKISAADNLTSYVDYCFTILESDEFNEEQIVFVIYVLKGLIIGKWTKNSTKDSRMYQFTDSILDKLLQTVTSIVKETTMSKSVNLNIFEACGELVKDILHFSKDMLTAPRVYYCLQICNFSPLHQLIKSPDKYSKALNVYYSILNQFFLNHKYMVASCVVLIKDLIQNYLTSLIQICDTILFANYDKDIQKDLINGATDLNKLITALINDSAVDFAPFAPHIISTYVNLLHIHTIHPFIKKQITLFIYRLLNVIKSNPNWSNIFDLIHCRLDQSGRNLLKILFENYEKFYVLKGRF